jgi:hypothetical protein
MYTKGENAGMPRPTAFKPELWEDQWELSVCRKTGLEDQRVWEIGQTCRKDKRPLLARADVGMGAVHETKLTAVAAPTVFPEHAVVLGWPSGTDKDARLAHQQHLAKAALVHLSPHQPTAA